MRVGRLTDSWSANSLAMGLSQGFIEPLEATAIHIVITTAQQFIAAFDDGGFGPKNRDIFNQRIAGRYEGIRDYIVAHYRMNRRADNAYWRDNATHDHLSDHLKAMITAWFTGQDLEQEIIRLNIGGYYGAISWYCLFAGYGVFPAEVKMRAPLIHENAADMARMEIFMNSAARNFSPHAQALIAL